MACEDAAVAMRHVEPGPLLVSLTNACGRAGERRWRITDVVGAEDGLGVECLSGSGAIASAYSRAFREGFTITLVSGRTVGIGAYLARLGRRRALHPQFTHRFVPCSTPLCRVATHTHARSRRARSRPLRPCSEAAPSSRNTQSLTTLS